MNTFTVRGIVVFVFLCFCFLPSFASNIRVFPDKNLIIAPSASHYEWYFNGMKLTSETYQELSIPATGQYTLVYETNGDIQVESIYLIKAKNSIARVYLIGDSTVTDYTVLPNYLTEHYPQSGWGEKLQSFMRKDSLYKVPFLNADSIDVENYAVAGYSSKRFWNDWKWKFIQSQFKPGDFVFIQFGHNDALDCSIYPEQCVSLDSFKTYLRWYIDSVRRKNAVPVLITPMVRSLWRNGTVYSDHGNYPAAMKQVGTEKNVKVIDLTQRSIDLFNSKGAEYVNNRYFMIFNAGTYPNYRTTPQYPNGSPSDDNTHFKTEGAFEMARLIFNELKGFAAPTSIGKIQTTTIDIYPNPANDFVVIKRSNAIKEYLQISDIKGAVVSSLLLNSTEHRIDVSMFLRGVYVIRIGDFKYKLIKL